MTLQRQLIVFTQVRSLARNSLTGVYEAVDEVSPTLASGRKSKSGISMSFRHFLAAGIAALGLTATAPAEASGLTGDTITVAWEA